MIWKIRNATLKDKKDISDLWYQLYPERRKVLKGKSIPINKFNAKSILLVAEKDEKIIGFIWATFISYGISRFGYIEELFIKRDFRTKGIGSALVKAIIKRLRKLKAQALFVSTTEKKAMPFYKKLGFKISKGWFSYKIK